MRLIRAIKENVSIELSHHTHTYEHGCCNRSGILANGHCQLGCNDSYLGKDSNVVCRCMAFKLMCLLG